jgi:iron complex outermembrane receptor protein
MSTEVRSQDLTSDTTAIPTVIIRGTPVRDTLKNIPAAVTVQELNLLTRKEGAIITSALNQTPGVYMQQGALNTNRISIRGIGSRSQYSTNRVKAYIDGIPISTAAGSTVMEDIDPNILKSIEIIKGPASSIYGTGLGGVINLYTEDRPERNVGAGITLGSFGLQKYSLHGNAGNDKSSAMASFNQVSSDGFRDNSEYERQSLLLKGRHQFNDRTSVSALAILTRVKAFIPSSLNREDFNDSPQSAAANWEAAEGYESYDRLIAGLSIEHRFSEKLTNTTSLFTQIRDAYEPRPFDILEENRKGYGGRTRFNFEHNFFGKPSELAFGGEILFEDYTAQIFENRYEDFPDQGSVQGEKLSQNNQLRQNLNAFVQERVLLSEKWILEAGLNLNSTSYELEDEMPTESLDQTGDYRYETIASPRVGLLYKLRPDRVIYATISHGFSAPGVEETLTPDGEINTDLKPETGINYEAGLKADWLDGLLYTELALYTIQIDNLLVAQRIAEDRYIGINAGETAHSGVELTLRLRRTIGSDWLVQPYLNGSYNHYRFQDFVDDGEDYSGNEVTGAPTHKANLGVEVSNTSGFRFRVNALHVGETPLNDANTEYADSYALINLQAAYTFRAGKKVEISLKGGINNLLNQNYAASILPNAIGFGGSAPRSFYPGDPRNGYVGIYVGF